MGNFEMTFGWRFGSAVLAPLVKLATPRDTYAVTCVGNKLRIDGALRGIDSAKMGTSIVPKWRRAKFSLVFDGDRDGDAAKLWFVDHESRTATNAMEQEEDGAGKGGSGARRECPELTDEEFLEARVDALLEDGAAKKKVRTEDFKFAPVKGWMSNRASAWIKGQKTEVWEATAKVVQEKISCGGGYKLDGTFEEYCASANDVKENVVVVKALGASSSSAADARGGNRKGEDTDDEKTRRKKANTAPKARKVSARCWLVRDFPISAAQLSKILDVLALANKSAKHVSRVVNYWRDEHADMFPVKIQLPLALTVYAQLQFKDFKALSSKEEATKLKNAYFDVPSDYVVKSVDDFMAEVEERAYMDMTRLEALEAQEEGRLISEGEDDSVMDTDEIKRLRRDLEHLAQMRDEDSEEGEFLPDVDDVDADESE
jgi:hypothetical protein